MNRKKETLISVVNLLNIFYWDGELCCSVSLPVFHCTVCGRKKRLDFEVSCTGDAKRNVEKAPWCCGKEMMETIDD